MTEDTDMAKTVKKYIMTDRDIRLMLQLRASNADVFTGRFKSALRGWRAISKQMGIQRKVTAQQLNKKWHNMKDKYRVLKNLPVGMETQARSWRWFHLMDAAMNGRLARTTNMVEPSLMNEHDYTIPAPLLPAQTDTKEDMGMHGDILELSGTNDSASQTESSAAEQDHMSPKYEPTMMDSPQQNQTGILYTTSMPDSSFTTNGKPSSIFSYHSIREHGEVDEELAEQQREWRALERELITLKRDREMVQKEMATLDSERALIKQDRAALERDQAALDRERVFLERAREDLEKERKLWRRERAGLEPEGTAVNGQGADMTTEMEAVLHTCTWFYRRVMAPDLDPGQLETRPTGEYVPETP